LGAISETANGPKQVSLGLHISDVDNLAIQDRATRRPGRDHRFDIVRCANMHQLTIIFECRGAAAS